MIDVIVPVYNVENYLHRCIESILAQTYKDFIIYLIDDGSTDSSGKICDEYAEKYSNIKVIHKKNGGLSDARNAGIDNSRSEYLTFIDSDDLVGIHYLEILHQTIVENDSDIAVTGLISFSNDNEIIEDINSNHIELIDKKEAYRKILMQDGCDVSAVAKLYKRFIFDKIRFPKGVWYEDIQIIDKTVETASSIAYNTYKGYFYYQREGSIMYCGMSEKRMVLLEKCDELINMIKNNYPDILECAEWRYVQCCFHVLGRSVMDNNYNEQSKYISKNLKKYRKKILKNKLYARKQKVAILSLSLGLGFYKFMWKFFCRISGKKMGN